MRRLLSVLWLFCCGLACASLPRATWFSRFTSDALNQLASITRSGTLTVSGSVTGAVATLGVNGQRAQIFSDGTFATTAGLALRDGNNLFVTAGSNAAGALVVSTITSNRLPVMVSFGYDLNGNLISDGQRVLDYDHANRLVALPSSNCTGANSSMTVWGGGGLCVEYMNFAGGWMVANESRLVYDGYLPFRSGMRAATCW